MTTFAGWLAEQRKRDDAVGWFARYWRDLPETPRLSSPSSICSHLENRTTKPGQDKAGERLPFGFTDPDGGSYVRDAYDATLHEYRQVRAEIVQSAAAADGVPGAEAGAEPQPASLAGQAVERATAAAQAAAEAHGFTTAGQVQQNAVSPVPGVTITSGSAALGTSEALLAAIYRKLEGIERFLGIATDEDYGAVPAELPWGAWYAQADLAAAAE